MKPYWKPLLFSALLLTLLMLTQLSAPKPLNWKPSFSSEDKSPFGAFVLFSRLCDLFLEEPITLNTQSLYELFQSSLHLSSALERYPSKHSHLNFIFISETLSLDSLDSQSLLQAVAAGSSAFLAAFWFPAALSDTLHFSVRSRFSAFLPQFSTADTLQPDTLRLHFLSDAHRRSTPYTFREPPLSGTFSHLEPSRTTVLGIDEAHRPNFIRVQFGSGAFYLCSNPYLFTNYYLLSPDGAEYVAKVLSHLPVQETIWDEYYKPILRRNRTPIRFVLQTDTLRYAYYLVLVGAALFIFVAGKRRQRAIPVRTPLRNTTLEFVETVGRVYLQHGDHKDLAEKKIAYFFDFLRTHLYLQQISFSLEFYALLSEKSGVPISTIESLFALIESIKHSLRISESELLELASEIEKFQNAITAKYNVRNTLSESH